MKHNEQEITAHIATLTTEINHMKGDIVDCKRAITDHADESRDSNMKTTNIIRDLQFSVETTNKTISDIQETLTKLNEFFYSVITIMTFIKSSFKGILIIITIISIMLGILKLLGKL